LLSQLSAAAPAGAVLVLVGSFAPPHRSHVAVADAAIRRLVTQGEPVRALLVVPNRDSYVQVKIGDRYGRLSLQNRVAMLGHLFSASDYPVIIDDVSGTTGDDSTITDASVHSLQSQLGTDPRDV
jgi:nicotinic acid mononucleotide adenylyltransferase